MVVVQDNDCHHSAWQMARVVQVEADTQGMVRAAVVRTSTGTLRRPVTKLVVLIEAES